MFRTGLSEALGSGLVSATGVSTTAGLTVVFSVFAIFFTEVTSNTAAATMLVPLAIASAQAAGASPLEPALGCGLGCSMAFMLPVATPPNAIVYGSGLVPIGTMARAGLFVNLAACVVIPVGVLLSCRSSSGSRPPGRAAGPGARWGPGAQLRERWTSAAKTARSSRGVKSIPFLTP